MIMIETPIKLPINLNRKEKNNHLNRKISCLPFLLLKKKNTKHMYVATELKFVVHTCANSPSSGSEKY